MDHNEDTPEQPEPPKEFFSDELLLVVPRRKTGVVVSVDRDITQQQVGDIISALEGRFPDVVVVGKAPTGRTVRGCGVKRLALAVLFVGTVIGANWALSKWGVISIGFGLSAPAGVLFAGIAFGLRDGLHEAGGSRWVLACIAIGAVLSYVIEDAVTIPGGLAPIAVASGVAFGLSELLDWAVYTPLRERNWPVAVVASNVAGAVADSALFLWLAFGSLDYIAGQIVGKSYMVAAALPIVWMLRRDLPRHTVNAAGA